MDTSIFADKNLIPDDLMLTKALGNSKIIWDEIIAHVYNLYPSIKEEWKYPGQKYGWSFRLKDNKRVIVYLLPRDGKFMAALIFGEKGFKEVMESDVNPEIKKMLTEARAYAEGRGIRVEANSDTLSDIKTLIGIKLKN